MEIRIEDFEDLSIDEKESAPNNGNGKEDSSYIRVMHGGKTICLQSDAMEPEDAVFYRDLKWIPKILEICYNFGKNEIKDV